MDNEDIRRFLLAHRRIMRDREFAEVCGVSEQALSQFLCKSGRTTGNTRLRLGAIQKALGLEVVVEVRRGYKPKEEI